MKPLNHILTDIFSGFPLTSSKNTKKVLKLITKVPEHKRRLESIFSLSGNTNITVSQLHMMLELDLAQLANHHEEVELLIPKPLSGKNLNLIKEYTPLWLMHALYWGYSFSSKSEEEILSIYNHRIGDIALKFIEFYHKMKQKEEQIADNKHPFSFYEFIAAGKVRAIEFLIGASHEK